MSPTHVQLLAAVLLCAVGGRVTQRRPEHRQPVLIVIGVGFLVLVVGWWTPLFIVLVVIAHLAERRRAFVVAIVLLVGVLAVFKVRAAVEGGLLGAPLFVPVGLSYLVFQLVGYLVDVRRGRIEGSGPGPLLAFALLPPIRMSGPVLRFREFRRDLERSFPSLSLERLLAGLALIGVGLVKKRLLADGLLSVVGADAWPLADLDGLAKSAIQLVALYFDASGFADIAEGCLLLLGFRIPASFSRPLTRGRSLTDFWRRWQMSVMGWFRDYVYAPVRGDGTNPVRARLALATSFVASAAWHGLHPIWFVWGALTVAALALDQRLATGRGRSPAWTVGVRGLRRAGMYLYLFALTTLLLAADRETFDSVQVLFTGPLATSGTLASLGLLAAVVAALVVADRWRADRKLMPLAVNAGLAAAGVACLAWPGTIEPFVYQRF